MPFAAALVLLGVAWAQWKDYSAKMDTAEDFFRCSRIVTVNRAGSTDIAGRKAPVYAYTENGETMKLVSWRNARIPPDGKTRIGRIKVPSTNGCSQSTPNPEIGIPIDGPDSVETVYASMYDTTASADFTKAIVVSMASIVGGVAAFFLQRLIFKAIRRR